MSPSAQVLPQRVVYLSQFQTAAESLFAREALANALECDVEMVNVERNHEGIIAVDVDDLQSPFACAVIVIRPHFTEQEVAGLCCQVRSVERKRWIPLTLVCPKEETIFAFLKGTPVAYVYLDRADPFKQLKDAVRQKLLTAWQ